jgi:hypothetical protein
VVISIRCGIDSGIDSGIHNASPILFIIREIFPFVNEKHKEKGRF